MAKYKLSNKIIKRSIADTWLQAKQEWFLYSVHDSDYKQTCSCGHYPIKEICIIKNKHNSHELTVGNCCVKKFFKEFESDKIFKAKKRVEKNKEKSFNQESIELAYKKEWIKENEYKFYLDIWRKKNKNLSPKQFSWKIDINKKILRRISKEKI
jgi:ribosome-binding protein aMBF1 (putative translation factor)